MKKTDFLLSNKKEAETVLEAMKDIITRYGNVSVEDLYDLVNLPSTHKDSRIGWTDLSNVQIVEQSNGKYLIDLQVPTTIVI